MPIENVTMWPCAEIRKGGWGNSNFAFLSWFQPQNISAFWVFAAIGGCSKVRAGVIRDI